MCDCGCGFRNGKLGCLCLETKKSFIFEHNSREICDRGRGKELRQKHNADLEVPKYLKQKKAIYLKPIRSQNTSINMKNV